jgi:hypothetical protein
VCICGNIGGTLPLTFPEDNMSLLFRTQVQIAIKNQLETIQRLLDAPDTEERDDQIKRHLHLIESLVLLEPSSSRDTLQIETHQFCGN